MSAESSALKAGVLIRYQPGGDHYDDEWTPEQLADVVSLGESPADQSLLTFARSLEATYAILAHDCGDRVRTITFNFPERSATLGGEPLRMKV